MKIAALGLAVALFLMMAASSLRDTPHASTAPPAAVVRQWKETLLETYRRLDARQVDALQAPLEIARAFSRRYPTHKYAAKTAEYSGYELLLRFKYNESAREYLRAKQIALAAGEPTTAAGAMHALSNLYFSAGNLEGAQEAARQAVNALPSRESATPWAAAMQTHYARTLSRSGRFPEAKNLFGEIISRTGRARLTAMQADAWKLLSREHAVRGELESAGHAIQESLRLRILIKDPELASDYHDLADIAIRGGRYSDALAWLDKADESVSRSRRFEAWRVDAQRARVRLALEDAQGALAASRRAVEARRRSSGHMLPGDWLRSHSALEEDPHHLLVEAALAEHHRTGNPAFLEEAFGASEALRALSLRTASGLDIPPAIAERYWSTVRQLDQAYARLLLSAENDKGEIAKLRLQLGEMEVSFDTAAGISASANLQAGLRSQLRDGEALIAFQMGDRESLAWTLTRQRLSVTRLPGKDVIAGQLKEWLADIAAPGHAARVYQTLFAVLPAEVHRAPSWLLAVDGPLFEAPLAALVVERREQHGAREVASSVYLVERHSLQIVPGAWTLGQRRRAPVTGGFLGVGDPVYNQADPRGSRPSWHPLQALAASPSQLARLAGSAAEVSRCARQWQASRLLMGPDANPVGLRQALSGGSAFASIHLAIHVVPAPDSPKENLLALSLGGDGNPTYLGPEWIGALRIPHSLVVMNGCRSGSGRITAEGLMGLSRAWLRAGASRVLSTYWPTNDDAGAFAGEFYRLFQQGGRTHAEALRQAQLRMISASDWRAKPKHWAVYFLIGFPQ